MTDATAGASHTLTAARYFGRLLGENIAHEVGHSLGLTPPPHGDSANHNLVPSAFLMDAGDERDFDDRTGYAMITDTNKTLIKKILPLDP